MKKSGNLFNNPRIFIVLQEYWTIFREYEMFVLKFYDLASPQINNRTSFFYDQEEKEGNKHK